MNEEQRDPQGDHQSDRPATSVATDSTDQQPGDSPAEDELSTR
ncbi:hypothetical protein [Streptomyces sp. CB03911]|nr:hypothetical protein [Streptomyces sp. CB03911]